VYGATLQPLDGALAASCVITRAALLLCALLLCALQALPMILSWLFAVLLAVGQ
jgi:hypothetical protein